MSWSFSKMSQINTDGNSPLLVPTAASRPTKLFFLGLSNLPHGKEFGKVGLHLNANFLFRWPSIIGVGRLTVLPNVGCLTRNLTCLQWRHKSVQPVSLGGGAVLLEVSLRRCANCKGLNSLIILVTWVIWKHRNAIVLKMLDQIFIFSFSQWLMKAACVVWLAPRPSTSSSLGR